MYRWIKAGLLDQPLDAIQARRKLKASGLE